MGNLTFTNGNGSAISNAEMIVTGPGMSAEPTFFKIQGQKLKRLKKMVVIRK